MYSGRLWWRPVSLHGRSAAKGRSTGSGTDHRGRSGSDTRQGGKDTTVRGGWNTMQYDVAKTYIVLYWVKDNNNLPPLYRDRELLQSVEDLQSTTRLAVQSCWWLFFSYHIQSPQETHFFSPSPPPKKKWNSKHFLVKKPCQLWLILTSHHCMIYDVTKYSLKQNCLSRGR